MISCTTDFQNVLLCCSFANHDCDPQFFNIYAMRSIKGNIVFFCSTCVYPEGWGDGGATKSFTWKLFQWWHFTKQRVYWIWQIHTISLCLALQIHRQTSPLSFIFQDFHIWWCLGRRKPRTLEEIGDNRLNVRSSWEMSPSEDFCTEYLRAWRKRRYILEMDEESGIGWINQWETIWSYARGTWFHSCLRGRII